MVSVGPPWWRPFRRWKWRRFASTVLMSPIGLAHWSASEVGQEFWSEVVISAQQAAESLSAGLPDGFEVRYDTGDEA